jgi:hypothetical protein
MTPDERRARRRELYKANRTRILARQKMLRDQNREKVREQARARYQVNRAKRLERAERATREVVRQERYGEPMPRRRA